MPALEVVGSPSNFEARGYVRMTSDVFNICERIAEKFPSLRVLYNESDPEKPWVVTEMCLDGVERFVAKYVGLDARIIESLERMLRIPYQDRLDAQDKLDAAEKAKPDEAYEEALEDIATLTYRALQRQGLTDGGGKNFRKKKRG